MNATDTTPAIPVTLPDDAPRVVLRAADAGRGKAFEMTRAVAIIGSRRDCDVAIEHADCSKVHAALVNSGRQVYLFDLNSRTGTFVNDDPIKLRSVVDGDTVRIAGRLLTVSIQGGFPRDDEPRLPHALCLVGAQERHQLVAPVSLIGRRTNCDVHVDHPDVSLAHALVLEVAGCAAVFDLGSRGGTTVNGRPVTLTWLRHGDRIEVGDETLSVEWSGSRPPDATPPARCTETMPELPVVIDADLEDIEQTIATLHAAMASSRRKLDEQTELLAAREAQLESLTSEVEQARNAMAQREQALAAREAEFHERRAQLEALEREHGARLAEVEAQRAALEPQRREIEQAREAIDAREAAIREREAQLAASEKSQQELTELLDQERSAIEAGRAELDALRREVEEARAAAQKLQAEGAERMAQVERRAAELDAQAAAVESQLGQARRAAAEIEAQRSEIESAAQQHASRSEALARRAEELDARAADLDLRAEELREEREEFDAKQQKFEKARTALKSATRLFSTPPANAAAGVAARGPEGATTRAATPAPPSAAEAPCAAPDTAPPSAAKPAPANAAPGGKPDASRPAPAKAARTAPAASKGSPQAAVGRAVATDEAGLDADPPAALPPTSFEQLAPEQQERFRVLKRISGKNDADILAQLEVEAKSRPASPADDKQRKSKRGWWS